MISLFIQKRYDNSMETPLKITVNLLNFFSQVHIFPAYIYLQKSVFRM